MRAGFSCEQQAAAATVGIVVTGMNAAATVEIVIIRINDVIYYQIIQLPLA